MTKVLDTQLKEEELISREDPGRARRCKAPTVPCRLYLQAQKSKEKGRSCIWQYHLFFLCKLWNYKNEFGNVQYIKLKEIKCLFIVDINQLEM